jgi:hypothetical protein
MKRPVLFLSVLFVAILFSTVVVSTTISGICRSFYNDNTEKSMNVKSAGKPANDVPIVIGIRQASVKL